MANPNRPDIYGLTSVDTRLFFAVGTAGTVLKSGDSGHSWTRVHLRTTIDLWDIAFRGHRGYIVGAQGRVFATSDGGNTWGRVPLPPNWDCNAVCLASDEVHYIAGEGGRIYKTVDSGCTWVPLRPAAAKRVLALAFQDAQLGYAVGVDGLILETIDGGSTWRRLAFEPLHTLGAISFPSTRIGYMCGSYGTVGKTATAGGPHVGPLPRWVAVNSGVANHLRDLTFFNDHHGIIVGNGDSFVDCSPGIALETKDGGVNWHMLDIPTEDALLSIHFANRNVGCVAGGSGNLCCTDDGGATWERADVAW